MIPQEYYRKHLRSLYKTLIPYGAKHVIITNKDSLIPKNYDYYVIDNSIGNLKDIQSFFKKLQEKTNKKSRVITTYYNHLWEPALKMATNLGLREEKPEQNWLDDKDLSNLLDLSGFQIITTQKRFLFPFYLPFISEFINKWIANLPIINSLCLTTYVVAKPKSENKIKDLSVSIIIPARNEAGNISKIPNSIPKFGKSQEIIFVEGHSNDDTWGQIKKESEKKHRKGLIIKMFKQRGKGKADAVRLGFKKATGDILIIYDADRTVNAKDLKKFYDILASGKGEFVNGSRLVYPMEKDAMRTLNKIGNKMFSYLFTWILGQRFKDTLCGTKALFKTDYEKIKKIAKKFGEDPFGDFDLIFGAIKLNLKVVEIPVRYGQRTYGSTNISRFKHGLQLAKITWRAFRIFKTI